MSACLSRASHIYLPLLLRTGSWGSRERKKDRVGETGGGGWGGGEASAEVMSAEMVQLRAPQEYLG